MNYRQIQDEVIQKYWVKIDTDSSCYGRTHAHIREKKGSVNGNQQTA